MIAIDRCGQANARALPIARQIAGQATKMKIAKYKHQIRPRLSFKDKASRTQTFNYNDLELF